MVLSVVVHVAEEVAPTLRWNISIPLHVISRIWNAYVAAARAATAIIVVERYIMRL